MLRVSWEKGPGLKIRIVMVKVCKTETKKERDRGIRRKC